MNLTDFKVLTFDCYGTLIDWEAGIAQALSPLMNKADTSREQALETFAKHESAQEEETPSMPYSQLLSFVYKRLAKEWSITVTNEEANIFGASVPDWPEFPDSAEALAYLKRHYKLIILSNVDRISFRSSNARLKVEFDAIYSAQDIESYKPSLRNFEYMISRVKQDFDLEPSAILHTAQSLFHDHAPANQMGLASAWIDRRHAGGSWGATMAPPGMPHYDYRFESMGEMARAHAAEHTGH
ncbi:MAG: haloacid dehalogenase type II [bacterium]